MKRVVLIAAAMFACCTGFMVGDALTQCCGQQQAPVRYVRFVPPAAPLARSTFVQPKPAAKKAPVKKYAKGRVVRDPKLLAKLKLASFRTHAPALKRLPKCTAPSWDCRLLGLVGPIKDQSQCGSCWDFSGTCVVEGALYKAGAGKPDGSFALSEQYTLDCGKNGGCNGDDNTTVLEWAKQTGLPLSSAYGSYNASEGRCKDVSAMKLWKIQDWGFCATSGDKYDVTPTQDIKNAMVKYGPIGCAVDAGFSDPGDGVISGGGRNIDHDVTLVGWDDSKGRSGAWIMRNSWGTGWGNKGYAWIEYGSYSIGTEAVWATAGPAPVPTITSPLSASAAVGSPFTYTITASNVPTSFDATGLPPGLTVDTGTGTIAGTPTIAGTSNITVSATNAGATGTATLVLTVTGGPVPPGPVPPGPGPLPSGIVVNLTTDQVASVIAQAGGVVLTRDTTIGELISYLHEASKRSKPKAPCCDKKLPAKKE